MLCFEYTGIMMLHIVYFLSLAASVWILPFANADECQHNCEQQQWNINNFDDTGNDLFYF